MDWEGNKMALWSFPIARGHWLTTQILGLCCVQKMMKIWGQSNTDSGSYEEMKVHILACSDPLGV